MRGAEHGLNSHEKMPTALITKPACFKRPALSPGGTYQDQLSAKYWRLRYIFDVKIQLRRNGWMTGNAKMACDSSISKLCRQDPRICLSQVFSDKVCNSPWSQSRNSWLYFSPTEPLLVCDSSIWILFPPRVNKWWLCRRCNFTRASKSCHACRQPRSLGDNASRRTTIQGWSLVLVRFSNLWTHCYNPS